MVVCLYLFNPYIGDNNFGQLGRQFGRYTPKVCIMAFSSFRHAMNDEYQTCRDDTMMVPSPSQDGLNFQSVGDP